MELIMVRHGRPERVENAEGPADPPLTEAGHRQAVAAAEWLKAERIDSIYVSPMVRARETSAPLEQLLGLDPIVVAGIREFDAEEAEYIPVEELKADKERWKAFLADQMNSPRAEFEAEVLEAMTKIAADNRGKRVAVVCHGGVINAWSADVLGIENSMFFNPHYTSINRSMVASSGERSIVSLNDIGHLRPTPELILH